MNDDKDKKEFADTSEEKPQKPNPDIEPPEFDLMTEGFDPEVKDEIEKEEEE